MPIQEWSGALVAMLTVDGTKQHPVLVMLDACSEPQDIVGTKNADCGTPQGIGTQNALAPRLAVAENLAVCCCACIDALLHIAGAAGAADVHVDLVVGQTLERARIGELCCDRAAKGHKIQAKLEA